MNTCERRSLITLTVEPKNNLVSTIGVLGSTLIGAGVLLALVANFDSELSLLKIAACFIASLLAYAASWYTKFKQVRMQIADALVFLGAIIFGITILLIGETYGFPAQSESQLLVWA